MTLLKRVSYRVKSIACSILSLWYSTHQCLVFVSFEESELHTDVYCTHTHTIDYHIPCLTSMHVFLPVYGWVECDVQYT